MTQASDAATRLLAKMAKEMNDSSAKVTKSATRLEKMSGQSVQRRIRALTASSRVIHKHAQRMAKLEARYRLEIEAMLGNSRRMIETAPPDDDIELLASSTAEMRESAVTSRAAMAGYQDTTQANRAMNISQDVNGACDELVAVLSRVIEVSDNVISYCDWVAGVAAGQQS